MNKVNWTKELYAVLKTRYQIDGPTKLAEKLGIPYFAVVAKARRLGIGSTRRTPPKGFKWTPDKIEVIQQRYVSDGGEVLAREWGIGTDTVRRKASSMGLHTTAGILAERKVRAANSTSCDIHYFDKWTPNMAYILGFLFADGSVNKGLNSVTINLTTGDECVLQFIHDELKITHPIRKMPGRGNDKPQSGLGIHSTVVVSRLMELGLKPRKTYNNDPFPDVPVEMLPHFIRGYLDGDGTVCLTTSGRWNFCTVGFVGSVKFIEGVRDHMVRLADVAPNKVQVKQGKTAVWSTVAWTGNHDLSRIYNFLYPLGYGFCLERKRMKLDEWTGIPRFTTGKHQSRSRHDIGKINNLSTTI